MSLAIAFGLAFSLPLGSYVGDFGSFWASGDALSHELNPYGVYELTGRSGDGQAFPQLNPPATLPLFQLLALFPPVPAFRAWYALNVLVYGLAVYLLARRYPAPAIRLLWTLSLGGLWQTLWLGQIYLPLILALAAAWLLLPKRPVLAGLLLGIVVAVKPNFFLVPVLLLISGHLAVALTAGLVCLVLYAGAAVLYGPAIYLDWLVALRSVPSLNLAGSLASLVGWPPLAFALPVLLSAAVACWVRWVRPGPHRTLAVALCLTLLAIPWTGLGYTLCLLPSLWPRRWTPPLTIAAAFLVVPWPLSQFLWTGHLAALLLLVSHVHSQPDLHEPAPGLRHPCTLALGSPRPTPIYPPNWLCPFCTILPAEW
jgi:hypothetical protein